MKKIILPLLFILILPLWALSQQKPAGWLTPYANTEFKDGKIVYTISNPQQRMDTRLLPLMYPRNLVLLRMDNQPTLVNGKYIGESQQKIRDYIDTEPVNLRSDKEKNEYLRLAAMVLLWDLDLSKHCRNEIEMLQANAGSEIKQNAGTVLAVLKVFEENRRK